MLGLRFPGFCLAFAVGVELEAGLADDPGAGVAVRLESVFADQRADALAFSSYHIKCIQACDLGVEGGAGMLVEQAEGTLGSVVPAPVDRAGKAANAAQLSQEQARGVVRGRFGVSGLVRRRERCELTGRLCLSSLVLGGLRLGCGL